MRQISASIITLTGGILILGGAYVQHDGTQTFVMTIGSIVGLMGLCSWCADWYISSRQR
jgi:hypothetical protein